MKSLGLALACWLVPATLVAQVAPVITTTVQTTDTSATSACIGCAVGSTTAAANSGLKAATISVESLTAPSITTNKLYNVAGALIWNGVALATGSTIAGTAGTIGKFTGVAAMGDSLLTQSGTTVTMTGALTATGTITGNLFSGSGNSLTSIPTSAIGSGNYVATVASGTGITSSATSGTGAATTISLNNTAVAPTQYGSATSIAQFTVDQQGRLTQAAGVTPQLTLTTTYFSSLSGVNLTGVGRLASTNAFSSINTFFSAGENTSALATFGLSASTSNFTMATLNATTGAAYVGWNLKSSTDASDASKYVITDYATKLDGNSGAFVFSTAPSGTAGNAITWTAVLKIHNSHGVSVGDTTDPGATNFRVAGTSALVGAVSVGGTNVTDAVAAPTITSGFGTSPSIAGKASFFTLTVGTGSPTTGVVAFNATYANAPVCVASYRSSNSFVILTPTTTQLTITGSVAWSSGENIYVLCRGY